MSKTFREWDVDQGWLLPPSVHKLVPAMRPRSIPGWKAKSKLASVIPGGMPESLSDVRIRRSSRELAERKVAPARAGFRH